MKISLETTGLYILHDIIKIFLKLRTKNYLTQKIYIPIFYITNLNKRLMLIIKERLKGNHSISLNRVEPFPEIRSIGH